MDLTIAGVSAYQQSNTIAQVGVVVDAKVLQNQRDQGAEAVQLIEAATPHPNQAATNGRVDTYA